MIFSLRLVKERWVSYDKGKSWIDDQDVVYEGWIKNKSVKYWVLKASREAGLYSVIFKPKKNYKKAGDIIDDLKNGLHNLQSIINKQDELNEWKICANELLLGMAKNYLDACIKNPKSIIKTYTDSW